LSGSADDKVGVRHRIHGSAGSKRSVDHADVPAAAESGTGEVPLAVQRRPASALERQVEVALDRLVMKIC
jgi:hypothetical protein